MKIAKSVYEFIAVPVVVLDGNFHVVFCNKKAQKTLGKLAENTPVWNHFSKKTKFEKLLKRALETGKEHSIKVASKQEFRAQFLVTVSPDIQAGKSETTNLVLTFEDRTPAQDAKSMRSEFVANVSHEIRSPLTAISGFVETLQGPARDDREARENFLGMMEAEITRMSNLVRDLLSLSHVEAKERSAPRKNVDPNLIIKQAMERASQIAQKNGKTLVVVSPEFLPEIRGNHDDLVRVLINLVENAVTYSRENSEIRLSAGRSVAPNPLSKNAIWISVKDEGEGIAASEIPLLTQRFYRIDKSRSRNVGGTGLGLAIVKHIIKRHRGKLMITSVPGQGSDFRIFLPEQ